MVVYVLKGPNRATLTPVDKGFNDTTVDKGVKPQDIFTRQEAEISVESIEVEIGINHIVNEAGL